jgi:hypothetical protein
VLKLITSLLLSLMTVHANAESKLSNDNITEIAAYFQTKKTPLDQHQGGDAGQNDKQKISHWFLWRQADKIEIQSQNKAVGEVWQKLKHGQVEFIWLYHAKQFAIKYTASDLKALQNYPTWSTKTSLVSQALLQRLKKIGAKQVLGYKADIYQGKVDGLQLEIEWIDAIKTPARIRQTDNKATVEVTLLEVYPLKKAPWQPIDSEQYDDMDYADIGDNESHPIARLHMNGKSLSSRHYPEHHH